MAKNCRIYETLANVKEMKIEKKDGLMTLSGTFGVCGVRNNNKRVYEMGNYGARVKELQAQIKENNGIPGELEHPETMNITLENISHKITRIEIDENGVVSGEIQLLNTPKGKIAQSIVEGGLPLFVSSRATGQVDKNGNVTLEKLCTYDLVGTPGFSQARMHLNESQVCENLSDNITIISEGEEIEENNTENDMTENAILERIEALEKQVKELQEENATLKENSTNIDIRQLADSIEKWVVEEFAPEVQNWVMEEYHPHIVKETKEEFKNQIVDKLAPAIEKWVVEEFSPEVEKWVVESFAPEVQNWFCEHAAPAIQNWMVTEYATDIEGWINEEYSQKVGDMIAEGLTNNKSSKLQSIAETLALLESMESKKPSYGPGMVNENQINEPFYIQQMPEQYRPQYNMASQELKESIARRAKIFDFTNEGSIARFWEKIDFNAQPAEQVHENLDRYEDQRERQIRAMFRRNRR